MVARLERADHEPSIATLQYLGAQLGLRTKIDIDGDEVRVRLLNGNGDVWWCCSVRNRTEIQQARMRVFDERGLACGMYARNAPYWRI